MKKFAAIVVLLALALLVYGCGSNNPPNAITTNTSGNWEALLNGGTGAAAYLNFVINFNVSNTTGQSAQGLSISGFSFLNNGPCFLTGIRGTDQSGSATITTLSTSEVTGTMSLTVTSNATSGTEAGSVLTLTATPPGGGVSGTSSGTPTSTGTLSNGIVWGVWNLSSSVAANQAMCGTPGPSAITGDFVMCQNNTTCTIPGSLIEDHSPTSAVVNRPRFRSESFLPFASLL